MQTFRMPFYSLISASLQSNISLYSVFSAYLSARFGGDLEGGLEGSPLLGGEDGAWPFGPTRVFAVLAGVPRCRALL